MRKVFWGNLGNISKRESARNALAQWANDCERRLLGLHCGQFLERGRHRQWADERIVGATFLMRPGANWGLVCA